MILDVQVYEEKKKVIIVPPTPNFVNTGVYKKKKKGKYFTRENKYPCGNLQSMPNAQKPAEGKIV